MTQERAIRICGHASDLMNILCEIVPDTSERIAVLEMCLSAIVENDVKHGMENVFLNEFMENVKFWCSIYNKKADGERLNIN